MSATTVSGLTGFLARSAVLALLLLSSTAVLLAAEPTLRITSPADGTTVQPGETVTLKVEASGVLMGVIVGAEDPIENSQFLTAPPYEFTIRIATRIRSRIYQFTAVGVVKPGQVVYSKSISLNVERTERPVSIRVEPSQLSLSVGEQGHLRVIGTYPDGSTTDITESKLTEYTSRSPSVATVISDGRVTAVGPGSTQIVINGDLEVPVTVRQARNNRSSLFDHYQQIFGFHLLAGVRVN